MPWVKIDDHFDEHPKLAAVGPLGWGMWLAGIAYCNRNLTNGFIPRNKAFTLCSFQTVEPDGKMWTLSRTSGRVGDHVDAEWVICILLEGGLWDEVPGGFRVHDYSDYQPTKDEVLAARAKKQAAGKAGGEATARARAATSAEAGGEADALAESKQTATSALAESKPVPVPVPKPVPNPKPSSKPPSPASQIDTDFETFWNAYPKRSGKKIGREQARTVWKRRTEHERTRALTGVEHYRQACDSAITIAKDAHRWLSTKAFDDWQTPATQANDNGFRNSDEWTPEERGVRA